MCVCARKCACVSTCVIRVVHKFISQSNQWQDAYPEYPMIDCRLHKAKTEIQNLFTWCKSLLVRENGKLDTYTVLLLGASP